MNALVSDFRVLAAFTGALTLAAAAPAAVIVRNSTAGTNLNSGTLWTGAAIPTSTDVAAWDSTSAVASAGLGANQSWAGIQVTNVTANVTLSSGNTLSLGSSGINLSSASASLIISPAISLAANQTWSIASGRSIQMATNSSFIENGNQATVTGPGTLDWRSNSTSTFSGIVGSNAVSVNGTTVNLTLTNSANSFTVMTVASGRLGVNSIGNFGQTSALGTGGTNSAVTIGGNLTSATLEYTGTSTTTNRVFTHDGRAPTSTFNVTQAGETLTITGNMNSGSQVNAAGNGWVFGGAGNLTLLGNVTDSTGVGSTGTTIVKNGTGTLTLGGTTSASGAITINDGTLQVGNGGSAGTITGNVSGTGSIIFNRSGSYTYAGTLSHSGALLNTGSGKVTLSGSISAASSVTNEGSGVLELFGANSYSSKTEARSGTIAFTNGNTTATGTQALGTNATVDLGVAGVSAGALRFSGSSTTTLAKDINALGNGTNAIENTGTAGLTLTGTLTKNGTTLALRGGTSGIAVNGVIAGSSANSDLVVDGGQVQLNNVNTYNGPTYVTNGATLIADVAGALPTSPRSAVIMDQTGSGSSTLSITANQAVASLTGASTSTVNLNANSLTVGTTTGNTTFAGTINAVAGSLLKDGASTLTLSGINNANITISAGALALGGSNVFADSANLTLNSGSLVVSGFSDALGTLTLGGNATIDLGTTGTLWFANSSGAIWAPGATLTITGTFVEGQSLRFGTDATGLTTAQLSQIQIAGASTVYLDANGYIAVPEPSTYALLALGGLACVIAHRRRRQA